MSSTRVQFFPIVFRFRNMGSCVVPLLAGLAPFLLPPSALSATYVETFTPRANRAYNEDINVWVYTAAFAERFGMPAEWVDEGLKGALAVAFRVETLSSRMIFPHKGPNASMLRRHCILDVYLDAEANIPWVDGQVADFNSYQPSSPSYLLPQDPEDQAWRWRPVGLPNWGGVIQFGTTDDHLGGFPVREYDRALYPGVAYLSLMGSCVTPPRTGAWIELHDYTPRNSAKPVWDLRAVGLSHRIEMPSSFMERLYADWHRRSRGPAESEWESVIETKER